MIWRCAIACVALVFALVCDHQRSGVTRPAQVRKVLLIGLDGVRPDALARAHTPNLDRLITNGAFADDTQILGDRYEKNETGSGPGWSSILTGVWADKHGVHRNDFKGSDYSRFPHLFERLKAREPGARTVSLVAWKPIHDHIVSAADTSRAFPTDGELMRGASLQEKMRHAGDRDADLAQEACRVLLTSDPTLMFLHFDAPDHAGHTYGFHPDIEGYTDMIARTDRSIGRVLDAIENRRTRARESWLVIVTTDHGGKSTGHGGGQDVPEIRTVFLIISGNAARKLRLRTRTYITDACATALAHLGVPIDPAWQLDGRPVGLK